MKESSNYSNKKDEILKYFLDNGGHHSVTEISANLDLDHHLCFFLSKKIEERGFIKSRNINTREAGKPDKILTLKPSGKIFLKNGGFKTETKKEKEEKLRKAGFKLVDVVHKIATTIVAIATLVLGYYSINLQSEINKIEKKIQTIEVKIDSINTRDTMNQNE